MYAPALAVQNIVDRDAPTEHTARPDNVVRMAIARSGRPVRENRRENSLPKTPKRTVKIDILSMTDKTAVQQRAQTATQQSGCGLERRSGEVNARQHLLGKRKRRREGYEVRDDVSCVGKKDADRCQMISSTLSNQ